jgi:hypothetical protein
MAETIISDLADGTDVTLTEILAPSGSREFRVLTDLSSSLRGVVFQNTFRLKANVGVDRRRIHVYRQQEDSITGMIHKGSVTCEFVIPPTNDISTAGWKDLIAILIAILSKGSTGVVDYVNVATIVPGGVPTGDFAA